MAETPRYVISDVVVDRHGDWYSGKVKIQNKQILTFFKKNLFIDANGMFIYNEFGGFSEKAYIKVRGPILKVTKIWNEKFILDNEESISIKARDLVQDSEERLYIVVDRLKAWAVLSREAVIDLQDRLTMKGEKYVWNNKPVRLLKEIPWFFG